MGLIAKKKGQMVGVLNRLITLRKHTFSLFFFVVCIRIFTFAAICKIKDDEERFSRDFPIDLFHGVLPVSVSHCR